MNARTRLIPLLLLLTVCLVFGNVFAAVSVGTATSDKQLAQQRYDSQLAQYNRDHPATGPADVRREVSSTDELNTLVTIGNGATGQVYPAYANYGQSCGRAVYTAAEIGQGGSITSIALNNLTALPATWASTPPDTFEIWLSETNYSSLPATTTSWPQYTYNRNTGDTVAVRCYLVALPSTHLTFLSGWNTFTLQTPFAYSGTRNLMVVVRSGSATWGSNATNPPSWAYTTTATNQFNYSYVDANTSFWSGAFTGNSLATSRPDIQIGVWATNEPINPTLVSPVNNATAVSTGASLTWTTGANTDNCDVYFSTNQADVAARNPAALVASATTALTYAPTLAVNQFYFWRVVSRNTTSGLTNATPVWGFNTFSAGLSGTHTIGGTTPDFTNFANAVTILNTYGVTGAVTFNVRPGTYSESITLNSITGMSATNTITFQKESAAVTLTPSFSASPSYGIKLNGADYVTFDGIDIADTTTTSNSNTEYAIWLAAPTGTNGAQYNTFRNMNITMRAYSSISTTPTTYAVYQYYTSTPTSVAGANSYNKYLNLKISKVRFGLYLYGTSSTYPDVGTEVGSTQAGLGFANRMVIGAMANDTIGGSSSAYGLCAYYQSGFLLHDIDVRNVYAINTTNYAVYIAAQYGAAQVYGNRIYNNRAVGTSTSRMSMYGLYLAPTTSATSTKVYNNMVWGTTSTAMTNAVTTTQYAYPVYILNGNPMYFDNNTVVADPVVNTATDLTYSNSCMYINGGTVTYRNNIFYNHTGVQLGTTKHYGIYKTGGTLSGCNNNVIFNLVVTNGCAGYYISDRTLLSDWQTGSSQDAASSALNPQLVSDGYPYDCHITTNIASTPVENSASVIPWVTTDIDNEARSATTPDIGADEGTFVNVSAPGFPVLSTPLNGAVTVPNPLSLVWSSGGNTDNYDVYFSTSQYNVQTLNAAALVTSATTSLTYSVVSPLPGTYYYWRVVARNTSSGLTSNSSVWSFQTLQPPLTGTPTIGGATPTYLNFSSAVAALNLGGVAAGGVTFQVRPGTYNENVTLGPITGMGVSAPIVFQATGTGVNVSPTVTGTSQAGIRLVGAQYVTFDGINVIDASTGSTPLYYGYYVTNNTATQGSQYNTIKNANVVMRLISSTSTYGVYHYYNTSATPSAAAGTNSYNRYLNLKISKTTYGVDLYSYSSLYFDVGNEIGSEVVGVNNPNRFTIGAMAIDTIGGPNSGYGIYAYYQSGLSIHDIDVKNMKQTSTNSMYGIYPYYCPPSAGLPCLIYNNRVYDMTATNVSNYTTLYGIYTNYYQPNGILRLYNNMIYNLQETYSGTVTSTAYVFGIYHSSYYPTTVNNTVVMNQTGTQNFSSECLHYVNIYAVNDTIKNNIFANLGSSVISTPQPYHMGIYNTNANGTNFLSNNNCFYIPNATGGFIGYNGGAYRADLASWQTALTPNTDLNSVTGDPGFMSATDFHIRSFQTPPSPVDNGGASFPWIPSDIDNEVRTGTPDIGADEGVFGIYGNPHLVMTQLQNMTAVNVVSFPTTIIGNPNAMQFKLRNTGPNPLTISNIAVNHSAVLRTDLITPLPIAPGDSVTMTVTWTPNVGGMYTDSLTFTHNGDNSPKVIPISGNAMAIHSLPLNENFAGTTFPPSEWSTNHTGPGTYLWTRAASGSESTTGGSAYMYDYYQSSGAVDWLITPIVSTQGVTNPHISFYRDYPLGGSEVLAVLYSTDFGATWTSFFSTSALTGGTGGNGNTIPSTPGTWAFHDIAVPAGAINQARVQFAFRATSAYGYSMWIDNVSIYDLVFPILAFNPTVATFSNRVQGANDSIQVYVKNVGAVTMHVTNVTATTVGRSWTTANINAQDSLALWLRWNPVTIGALVDTIRVISDASNSVVLPVTGTGLAVHPFSCTQNFASGTPWPPSEWTIINPDGGITWIWATPQWARINFYGYVSRPNLDYLVTPIFTTVGLTNAAIDFDWSYLYNSTYNDSLEVAYTVDAGVTWNRLWLRWAFGTGTDALAAGTGAGNTNPATSNYGHAHILLPAGALEQPHIQFAWIGHNDYGQDIFVTNISLYNANAPQLSFNPTTAAFGNRAAATNDSMLVYVKNVGATAMHITNVTAATLGRSWTTGTINALDSLALWLRWSPVTLGAFVDTIRVVSDASNALVLPVSGTGVAGALTNNNFTPPAAEAGSSFTFTADYNSALPLTIDSVRAVVNGVGYLLSATGGSLPGTVHFSGNIVLSTVGVTTYYIAAVMHDAVPTSYSTQTSTVVGPNVLPLQIGGPDGYGYTFKTNYATGGPAFNWIDISTNGTLITDFNATSPNYDDKTVNIPFGTFRFPFYGTTYGNLSTDSIGICTNGHLRFNVASGTGGTYAPFSNVALPSAELGNSALAFMYDDGQVSAGQWVRYMDMGDGRFVVSYLFSHLSYAMDTIEAQVIMYTNGAVQFQYRQFDYNTSNQTPTIGIQGSTLSTDNRYLQYGGATTSILPANNMTIQFTPPQPSIVLSGNLVGYGYVLANGGTGFATVYVRNSGPGQLLHITNVSAPLTVTPGFTTATINSGDSLALSLNWNPTVEGAFSGSVVITSDASNATNDTISLVGYAFLPPSVPAVTIGYSIVDHSANVTWPRPAGTVSGYKVYRTNITGNFELTLPRLVSTIADPNVTNYLDVGVTEHFYYLVTSYNSASSSSTAVVSSVNRSITGDSRYNVDRVQPDGGKKPVITSSDAATIISAPVKQPVKSEQHSSSRKK